MRDRRSPDIAYTSSGSTCAGVDRFPSGSADDDNNNSAHIDMCCAFQGFNCAEAVNFALKDWVKLGRRATQCTCSALEDAVRLNVRLFRPKVTL